MSNWVDIGNAEKFKMQELTEINFGKTKTNSAFFVY